MAAVRKRHLRRAVPSDAGNRICELRVKKTLVNSQNLPLLPQQNFKPCNLPERPLRTPYENPPNMDIFLKRSIFSSNLAMRHNGRKTRRVQTALTPLARDCPRQYFYSLPNGKRTSRERFAITRAKFRRQGSASLKICNDPKGAHGAGGNRAPPPWGIGFAKTRNTKKPPPRGGRPREIPHSEEIGAQAKKNEPRERFAFGRFFGNRPVCATAAAMGMPFHCRRTFAYGGLMPHMQAAPPPKPDGIRREAESGRPASCRISIPAGPTTASSG